MHQCHTTAVVPPQQRSQYWQQVIGSTYFPLALRFRDEDQFNGTLSSWQLGNTSISRLSSEGVSYRRLKSHLQSDLEDYFLITIPEFADVRFEQQGHDLLCPPGSFILEESDKPYEFSYADANTMWVLKIPGAGLRSRVGRTERFHTLKFDRQQGPGALFFDFLRLSLDRLGQLDAPVQQALSNQLIEMLVLALENDPRVLASHDSNVQNAHLRRIEQYARKNLGDAALTPEKVAAACDISVRYLHKIFKPTGHSFGQWLREQRLLASYDALHSAPASITNAQIAYQWGFNDQSQFCRAFKERFDCTPSEIRKRQKS